MASSALSGSDLQLGFYEQFFFSKDLEPYPVQERAFDEIFAGRSVLVIGMLCGTTAP